MPFPPDNETRFWRDFAMERGHDKLDPDYVMNAIKDIYENHLSDDGHSACNRTPRPVTPAENATPAHQCQPLPQPQRNCQSPRQHQPQIHAPRASVTSRLAIFGNVRHCPYASPDHRQRRRSVNFGVAIDPDPMTANRRPQWRPPPSLPNTPHNRSWNELPRIPDAAAPNLSPGHDENDPHHILPARTPDLAAWRFPTGTLSWIPHPFPHPSVSAAVFWSGPTVIGPSPAAPIIAHAEPLNPTAAARLTGGWPLPGAVPIWSPGTWPLMPWPIDVPVRLAPWLIPNPINSVLPQLEWDVSTHPSTARRVTGAHVNVALDMSGAGGSRGRAILDEPATSPGFDRILVLCDVGLMSRLWGPIVIEPARGNTVTIRDLLDGIHTFFQTPLTHAEVGHISTLGRDNYSLLVDAYRKRTTDPRVGADTGLRDWEWRQGLKRVDCLGDRRWWWGVWVTYNSNGTWNLNLGLVNPAHRYT
ncbi:hypothetical protein V8B97DRAFT_1300688 [Scleroderma yunnanense]